MQHRAELAEEVIAERPHREKSMRSFISSESKSIAGTTLGQHVEDKPNKLCELFSVISGDIPRILKKLFKKVIPLILCTVTLSDKQKILFSLMNRRELLELRRLRSEVGQGEVVSAESEAIPGSS